MTTRPALLELVLARLREFFREPGTIFWVYGFPVLLMIVLGLAFPGGGDAETAVDIVSGPRAEELALRLKEEKGVVAEVHDLEAARKRYRANRTDIVLIPEADGSVRYLLDPSRAASAPARMRIDALIQGYGGRANPIMTSVDEVNEPGSRYVDWLIPGLVGMNIMGGGLWGVGFVLVDLRIRKLLKRFVATPMRRSDFLLAMLISRAIFLVPEVTAILLAGKFIFGAAIAGSILNITLVILVGAFAFAGLGLFVASRAEKIETISGLMNLVMLPMWVLSGVFFAAERFPDVMQPIVKALPLTQLNIALRAVMLEGAGLQEIALPLGILAGLGLVSFALAIRIFKWQ